MKEILYGWTSYRGHRQVVENGKVISVTEIPVEEAKKKYYETRSEGDQEKDQQEERAAFVEFINME